jgi:hypothetical protein
MRYGSLLYADTNENRSRNLLRAASFVKRQASCPHVFDTYLLADSAWAPLRPPD